MNSGAFPVIDPWLWTRTLGEVYTAGLDPTGVGRRQRDARLARLLSAASAGSPFYRDRYREELGAAPSAATNLQAIEPVEKAELMRHFDEWATDRRITRASVEHFLSGPAHLADAYLGEYMVWTSSGTSGQPGIFVQDAQSLAAYDALDALRLRGTNKAPTWGMGQRFAFVAATGGYFAGVASIERLKRIATAMTPPLLRWLAPEIRVFSVQDSLPQLARELQDFAPTVLISYPSCAAALAQQQAEGALGLTLAEVWVGGEQLTAEQRTRIHAAFGCTLRNNYGASEFFTMAFECPQGHLHLNDDWLILEPVDKQLRPVPCGEASHSVLLTNLANHVQPLLRYRLGDSVRCVPQACACGSRFPVIEVQGRADHALVLHDAGDRKVTLLPLALVTVIEEGAHVACFQLLCTGPDALELRFEAEVQDPAAAFDRAHAALEEFLQRQGLANVRVTHGQRAPVRHAGSGKLSRVLAEPLARAPAPRRRRA